MEAENNYVGERTMTWHPALADWVGEQNNKIVVCCCNTNKEHSWTLLVFCFHLRRTVAEPHQLL